jgi:hypothetical protein
VDDTTRQHAPKRPERIPLPDLALLAGLAAVHVALHLVFPHTDFSIHPDFFVEEGARHDDWGFSNDSPYGPAQALLARLAPWSAEFSVRVLPLLLGAASILLCGLLARELGARRFGGLLAAFALLASAYVARVGGTMHSANVELLLWTASALLVARILRGGSPRSWLAVGALCGVGLVNKQTMALFVVGLLAGLLATPARRHLRSGWLWAGCALGLALLAPYLWWQARHGWPVFQHALDVRAGPWGAAAAPVRIAGQLLFLNLANVPLLALGLFFFFRAPEGRVFRTLGIVFVAAFAIMTVAGGKGTYGLPAYLLPLAAGARMFEVWLEAPSRRRLRWLLPLLIAAVGLALLPLAYPVLTPEATAAYARRLLPRLDTPGHERWKPLVSRCEDRYFSKLVERLAAIRGELDPRERGDCLLFTNLLIETAAVNELGPARGLPRALANSRAARREGPGDVSGETAVVFAVDPDLLGELYRQVETAATFPAREAACGKRAGPDRQIHVCRGLRVPLHEAWRRLAPAPAEGGP